MPIINKILRYLVAPLVALSVLGVVVVAATYFYYLPQVPSVSELKNTQLQLPLRVYSQEDKLIAEFGQYRRRPVTYEQVPKNLINAFIAIEDARYYQHKGVDFRGIIRSAVTAVKKGRVSQGASTITMQVARNFYLTNRRTIDRKLREAVLAVKIEEELNKEEILELYLNKIFLGKRAYGVGSAAEIYYGKTVEGLTLAQSAMIAGLPKAPSRYNPIINPKRAKERRDYILKRMFQLAYISSDDYQLALKEKLSAKVHYVESQTYAPYMAEMARADAIRRFGEKNIYKLGLKIYTTLDSKAQDNAINTLRKNLINYTKRHGYRGFEGQVSLDEFDTLAKQQKKLKRYKIYADLYPALVIKSDNKESSLVVYQHSKPITIKLKQMSWARPYVNENKRGKKPKNVDDTLKVGDIVRVQKNDKGIWELSQIPKVSGALVSMDPKNGAIRSIAGGFDFTYSKFNRALQAKRQPGSSMKPFVYAAALAKGYSPATTVDDKPLNLGKSTWKPENYGHKYSGPMRLRVALAKSKNIVSIRLLQEIGLEYALKYLKGFGFKARTLSPDLTLALGTGSATPIEMAEAYSSFANGGYRVNSHYIRKIVDRNGNIIFDADPVTVCKNCTSKTDKQNVNHIAKRVMNSQVHYQITSMLQSVAQSGTAARTNRLGRKDLAGKTGTTDDQKDAWFCGFNPSVVTTVWVGFDQIKPLGRRETAAGAALPIWMDYMKEALKGTKDIGWKRPRGLINVELDALTGMPPDEFTTKTVIEALIPKQIPTEKEIIAYMKKHKDDFFERQEKQRMLELLKPGGQEAKARQEDRIRRENAQLDKNHRRRVQARQRENDRLNRLGLPTLPSIAPLELKLNKNNKDKLWEGETTEELL